jgi:metallophosphoesterase (TIGR00282 family)
MRILFLGDIVGPPGVAFLKRVLRPMRDRERVDFVIANAENASGGSGMTPGAFRQLRDAGVDVITLGDHIYKKSELITVLEKEQSLCKPANFPPDAPGREFALGATSDGTPVAAFCLLGRTFMRPVDCPFRAADRVLSAIGEQAKVVLVDIHAEATADKYLLGHHLKGRVAAAIGTHTHVPTADEQILPGGTAFISDVGMTGPYDSILGRRIDRVLYTTTTFVPSQFEVATGDPRLAGVLIEADPATGKSSAVLRIMLRETDATAMGV